MVRKHRLLPTLALGLALPGCASIVSDNNSGTYIETDPEKARCELHGQDFTRVVETPNSVMLPSSAAPVTIACKANGYKNTTAVLDTKLDGWIFGNLLFGGIIGVAVDAARGAGQKFPPRFSLVLEPERFSSLGERDQYYDGRRKATEDKWARIQSDLQTQCGSGADAGRPDCSQRVDQAKIERDKEMAQIEDMRAKAKIGG
ncbi:MAG: hypothetical protein HQL44_15275 [Alphaproteobacteria bacterium]|nr:hypothetical protein [Alphaproteobacteria bacterium]